MRLYIFGDYFGSSFVVLLPVVRVHIPKNLQSIFTPKKTILGTIILKYLFTYTDRFSFHSKSVVVHPFKEKKIAASASFSREKHS